MSAFDGAGFSTEAFSVEAFDFGAAAPPTEVKLGAPGGGLTRMRRKQDEELLEIVLALISNGVL